MQVQFNRPATIGSETYGKGQHTVPDAAVQDNWFFDALVSDGDAVILTPEVAEEVTPEVAEEKPAKKGK